MNVILECIEPFNYRFGVYKSMVLYNVFQRMLNIRLESSDLPNTMLSILTEAFSCMFARAEASTRLDLRKGLGRKTS